MFYSVYAHKETGTQYNSAGPIIVPPLLPSVVEPIGPKIYVDSTNLSAGPDGSSQKPYPLISSAVTALSGTGGTIVLNNSIYQGPLTISGVSKPILLKPAPNINTQITCSKKMLGRHNESGAIYKIATSTMVGQVFYNGAFLPRARYPQTGFLPLGATAPSTTPYQILPLAAADVIALPNSDLVNATVTFRSSDYTFESAVVGSLNSLTYDLTINATPLQPSECSSSSPCHFGYRPAKDFGYFFENKLWMMSNGIGQAGSWVFDAPTMTLYVWLPDGTNPELATDLTVADDVSDCLTITNSPKLTIQGVSVTNSGKNGININSSPGLRLNQMTVNNIYKLGISGGNSDPLALDQSTISNTGSDGLRQSTYASNISGTPTIIENNTFTNIGIAAGFRRAYAGIGVGGNISNANNIARIRLNTLTNLTYVDIGGGYNSTIEYNTISNFCLNLDDCGGIYIGGRTLTTTGVNVTIANNFISTGTANLIGKPSSRGAYVVAGIYLDDYSHQMTVNNNTVTQTDTGLMGHNYHDNIISNNVFSDFSKRGLISSEDSVLKSQDGNGLYFYIDTSGNLIPVVTGDPLPANTQVSTKNNIFTNNSFISTNHKSQNILNTSSNQIPANSSQSVITDRSQAAFSGSGNSFANVLGPVNISMSGQALSTTDLMTMGIDPSAQNLFSRPFVNDWQTITAGAPSFTFSNSTFPNFTGNAAGGTISKQLLSCQIPSESGFCLNETSSAGATNVMAILPFPFPITASQVYSIHLQMMSSPTESGTNNISIYPNIIRNGPTWEGLDTIKQTTAFNISNDRWTNYDFYFATGVNLTSSAARLNLYFPANKTIILGATTITPVTVLPTDFNTFSRSFSNTDFINQKIITCGLMGNSCTGWKDLLGNMVTFPMQIAPRTIAVLWK